MGVLLIWRQYLKEDLGLSLEKCLIHSEIFKSRDFLVGRNVLGLSSVTITKCELNADARRREKGSRYHDCQDRALPLREDGMEGQAQSDSNHVVRNSPSWGHDRHLRKAVH